MSPNPRPSRLATNRKTEYLARMVHWPTVCASEVRQGFQDRSRGMKGQQESLTIAVVKHAANWPTASVCGNHNRIGASPTSGDGFATAVLKHGQAAPASINTSGSRQGFWATPNARDPKGAQGRMAKLGQMSDLPSQTEVAPTGQWNRANGKLNPRWVETLMGLPIGWTMPSCTSPQTTALTSCGFSAMESCLPPQSEPSEFFLGS